MMRKQIEANIFLLRDCIVILIGCIALFAADLFWPFVWITIWTLVPAIDISIATITGFEDISEERVERLVIIDLVLYIAMLVRIGCC